MCRWERRTKLEFAYIPVTWLGFLSEWWQDGLLAEEEKKREKKVRVLEASGPDQDVVKEGQEFVLVG